MKDKEPSDEKEFKPKGGGGGGKKRAIDELKPGAGSRDTTPSVQGKKPAGECVFSFPIVAEVLNLVIQVKSRRFDDRVVELCLCMSICLTTFKQGHEELCDTFWHECVCTRCMRVSRHAQNTGKDESIQSWTRLIG